jgi:hypothetical protein
MAHEKIEISNLTRETIVNTLVEPYYKDMVKTTIEGKKLWRILGISLETSSKIMVAMGGIFSFSAGFYHDDTLSFVAGSISCMSLALLQIASFSYKENKKQGDELNIILKKLNLDTIPAMARSEDQTTISARRYMPPPSLPNYNTYPLSHAVPHDVPHAVPMPMPVCAPMSMRAPMPAHFQRSNSLSSLPFQNRSVEFTLSDEYEAFRNEYAEFVQSTQKAKDEIQNLDKDLDEKLSKIQEREELLTERERKLNLIIV